MKTYLSTGVLYFHINLMENATTDALLLFDNLMITFDP